MSVLSIWENFVAGIALLAIEIFIITRIVKNYVSKRDKVLWGPFRAMFYRSIYQFNESLLFINQSWQDGVKNKLKTIHYQKELSENNILELRTIYDNTILDMKSAQLVFFNMIQTVGPSLTPDTGPQTTEIMYFFETLSRYVTRGATKLQVCDVERISDREYADNLLKDIWAILAGMEMLIIGRFSGYSKRLKDEARMKENLFFYKGEFLRKEDYEYIRNTDQMIEDYKKTSSKIERTVPVKSFLMMTLKYSRL